MLKGDEYAERRQICRKGMNMVKGDEYAERRQIC